MRDSDRRPTGAIRAALPNSAPDRTLRPGPAGAGPPPRSHLSTMAGSLRAAGWRPLTLAVLLLAVPCWPSNQASTEVSLARTTAADVVAVALVGSLLLALMRPGGTRLLRGGWLIPAAAIAGTAGISVFVAASPVLALAGYARFLEIFVLVPVAVAVVTIRLRGATPPLRTIRAVGAARAAAGIP